ncbi:hypothetical protein [Burkholderia territorii]|uniref:hypothetical protein n=1 Tax=Burkholderia territorii TaxID=1503055 RepID=UPI0012DADFE6|nr:hypothetical protein [Burkholderia territorii]
MPKIPLVSALIQIAPGAVFQRDILGKRIGAQAAGTTGIRTGARARPRYPGWTPNDTELAALQPAASAHLPTPEAHIANTIDPWFSQGLAARQAHRIRTLAELAV